MFGVSHLTGFNICSYYCTCYCSIRKASVDYSTGEVEFIWQTNFFSMFALTTACHGFLKRKRQPNDESSSSASFFSSSVINVGSVAGVTCMKSGTPYSSTKAAMNQLTGNWACEWGLDGIRVNCVAPWYINTELAQQVLKDEAYKASVLERTPMGRVGEPREVAGLVAFLCLPISGYITGKKSRRYRSREYCESYIKMKVSVGRTNTVCLFPNTLYERPSNKCGRRLYEKWVLRFILSTLTGLQCISIRPPLYS